MSWQPIETAPRDGSIQVVNDSEYEWAAARWAVEDGMTPAGWVDREGWWGDGAWMDPQPTHWFKIPARAPE